MIFFVSMPMVSCGGEEDEPDIPQIEENLHDPALIGEWKIQMEWHPEGNLLTYIYNFSKNGIVTVTSYIVDEKGHQYDEKVGDGKWETYKNKFLYLYMPDPEYPGYDEDIIRYRVDKDKLYFLGDFEYVLTRVN